MTDHLVDDLVRDGRCRICGKPAVTQDVVDEWRAIDWCERDDDELDYRNDLCWRALSDECIDEAGNVIEDGLMLVIERAERAEAEVERLREVPPC